jgi:holo-[acyl-carrier protein] synthase
MVSIGIDIESTERFRKTYNDKTFISLVFTRREQEYCLKKKEPYISFTGKFCAKEAIIKATNKKIAINSIEVLNEDSGNPVVYLEGKKMKHILCSISHTEGFAVATAFIENRKKSK